MRKKLTGGNVRDFACEAGKPQSFLWDAGVPGLAVRATAAGSKAFVFQAKLAGRDIRTTIGSTDHWDIEAARKEARRLQRLIDAGTDPREDRKEKDAAREESKRRAEAREATVGDIWPLYINERRHKWGARHLLDHERLADPGGRAAKRGDRKTEPGALASLMPARLHDLDAERVKAWLALEASKRPTQARLAFGALRAFVSWCAEQRAYAELAHPEAFASKGVRDVLPQKRAKDDALQREQLEGWFGAVRGISSPSIAAYLQCLLLTGARREEMATLEWRDLDFRWKKLTIKDKVEGERTIPLTPYVAHLLSSLPRIEKGNPFVFASAKAASGHLQDPTGAHSEACREAGIEGLSLHGLRRSFATLGEWVEVPVGIVAQIMGHKPSATAEKHYKRRPIDLLRVWHTKVEAWMLREARVDFSPPTEEKR